MRTFLKLSEVVEVTRLQPSTIYKFMASEGFPKPAKLGKATRWPVDEVEAWMESRLAARDEQAAA